MPHTDANSSDLKSLPTIQYPATWSKPKFALGDYVYPNCLDNGWLFRGWVVGLEYIEHNSYWICTVEVCQQCELLTGIEFNCRLVKSWNELELLAYER